MNELQALYEKVQRAVGKGRPQDIDAYISRATQGKVRNYAQLEMAVKAPSLGGGIAMQPADATRNVPGTGGKMPWQQAALIGASQGASLRFADELEGAAKAIIPGGQGYTEGRDAARARLKRAEAEQPGVTLAGELTGGFATPGMGALAATGRGMGVAGAGALVGGIAGGLTGIGGETEGTVGSMAASGGIGAGAGTVAGALMAKAVEGLVKAGVKVFGPDNKLTRQAKEYLNTLLKRQGMTREEALARMAEYESLALADRPSEVVLADVIPGGGRELRAQGDLAPRAAARTAEVMNARQANQAERVAGGIEEGMGTLGQPMTAGMAREAEVAAAGSVPRTGRRIYEPFDNQVVTDPEIARVLGTRDVAPLVERDPALLAGMKEPGAALAPSRTATEAGVQNTLQYGGATIDPRTGAPASFDRGGIVAVVSDRNPIPNPKSLKPEVLQAEVDRRVQALMGRYGDEMANDPSLYIGFDGGDAGEHLGVELSRHLPDLQQAVDLGTKAGQRSVWDPVNMVPIPTGGTTGGALDAAPIFFQHLQETMRTLRGTAQRLFGKGEGARAKTLSRAADELSANLEEALPGKRAADKAYRTTVAIGGNQNTESLFEAGRKLAGRGLSADEVRSEVAQIVAEHGQEGLSALRMGFIMDQATGLRSRLTGGDVARQFSEMGSNTEEIMKLLFPSAESFERFAKQMKLEQVMSRVKAAQGGSQTGARNADLMGAMEQGAMGGAVGGPGSMLRGAARALVGNVGQQKARQTAEMAGNALLSNPEQARTLLSGFNPAFQGVLSPMIGSGMSTGLVGSLMRGDQQEAR